MPYIVLANYVILHKKTAYKSKNKLFFILVLWNVGLWRSDQIPALHVCGQLKCSAYSWRQHIKWDSFLLALLQNVNYVSRGFKPIKGNKKLYTNPQKETAQKTMNTVNVQQKFIQKQCYCMKQNVSHQWTSHVSTGTEGGWHVVGTIVDVLGNDVMS